MRSGARAAVRTVWLPVVLAVVIGGCSTGQPTSASPTTRAPSRTATPPAEPRWPKVLGEPQQGDAVWGVYLAVANSSSDPGIDAAVRGAASVGYQAVIGDIACDAGAQQALGLAQYDYWSGATLYFATEGDARAFAAAYTTQVAAPKGVAKVKVGCLD